MKIIPLKELCDIAVRELEKKAPAANMKYHFDDGAIETVSPAEWIPATARQEVQSTIFTAISDGKIIPRTAYGVQASNISENPKRIIVEYGLSHADAVISLNLCGLGAELLADVRQTPEEIVQDGRTRKLKDCEIVALIDAEWTGDDRLPHWKIGKLFSRLEHETKDAQEQRGKRLRGKKT